jgi:hypothetical protein
LIEKSQLSSLALVNANHSQASFDKVIEFVRTSKYLEKIDLTWSMRTPAAFKKLFEVMRDNKKLTMVSVS